MRPQSWPDRLQCRDWALLKLMKLLQIEAAVMHSNDDVVRNPSGRMKQDLLLANGQTRVFLDLE